MTDIQNPHLDKIREICEGLADTTERPSHGAPTFFIKGKRSYLMFHNNHHGDGRLAIWCAARLGAQSALVASNPEAYFVPPYVGYRGWVGVRLDRDLSWEEIGEVVAEAYEAASLKR
jgi:hypothetical protein